ncbi:MAG: hypothetical protein ACTHOF_16720 [Flavisolibacter sp.]|jgi:hypothetical protein
MKILLAIACFFVMTAATAQTNNNPLWKKMIKENGRNETWKYAMANVKEFSLPRLVSAQASHHALNKTNRCNVS